MKIFKAFPYILVACCLTLFFYEVFISTIKEEYPKELWWKGFYKSDLEKKSFAHLSDSLNLIEFEHRLRFDSLLLNLKNKPVKNKLMQENKNYHPELGAGRADANESAFSLLDSTFLKDYSSIEVRLEEGQYLKVGNYILTRTNGKVRIVSISLNENEK
jgi:hypothetical protein